MTLEDFRKLWFRDKAYLLKRPSIDRINSSGDYTLKNCQFIEFKKNNLKKRFNPVSLLNLKYFDPQQDKSKARCGTVRLGMVWFGGVRPGMVRYGEVRSFYKGDE